MNSRPNGCEVGLHPLQARIVDQRDPHGRFRQDFVVDPETLFLGSIRNLHILQQRPQPAEIAKASKSLDDSNFLVDICSHFLLIENQHRAQERTEKIPG
jgi:hypothetical protein